MKKLIALVMALVMALSLTTVAWGANSVEVSNLSDLKEKLADSTVDEIVFNANIDYDAATNAALSDSTHIYDVSGKTINLNGKTFSANNFGIIFEGTDFTIKNGSLVALNGGSYALCIGDSATANVVVEDVVLTGGVNVYNASNVVLRNLTVTGTNYYAVWADECAEVIIESGTYQSNGPAVLGLADPAVADAGNEAAMTINGGEFVTDSDTPLVLDGADSGDEPVITGGTFDTNVSAYLAAGLTQTTDGVVVAEGGAALGAKYDMVTTDVSATKTVGVTVATFKANAPKDTNKDGLLDQDGNVKYVVFSNMNDKYFVQVNSVSDADYTVYQTGTKTLFGYFAEVASPYYEGTGVAFYDFGEKCGQYDDEPTVGAKYYTFQGTLYVADPTYASTTNLMVGNTLTPVIAMADEWVDHVPAYTYDKDYKVVGVKCAECGTAAVIYANYASVPKADKQAGNYYPVNDDDYFCWLAGPGAVVDTETKVESAETFDAGIAMYVGMSVMAATGAVVLKKRED